MEQLTIGFDDLPASDEERLRDAIAGQVRREGYAAFLNVERGKTGSFSVRARSVVAARVVLGKKQSYVEVPERFASHFPAGEGTSSGAVRVPAADLDEVLALAPALSAAFEQALSEQGGEAFGCCSRFAACSDARRCLHPDVLTSLACSYRKNLEEGRIFYGDNANA